MKTRDNTAGAAGFLIRPVLHGADIVIQSSTAWMSVNSQGSSGVIVDSGKFPWNLHGKRFPQFTEPSPGFHGLKIWDKFGKCSFIILARAAILRDTGPCMNTFAAFEIITGLETLAIRMERHSSNALNLAKWLESHETVGWVDYPGKLSRYFFLKLLKLERSRVTSVI
jgi:O-acetylhomoserine/O-acetylserine sulfhydrylase